MIAVGFVAVGSIKEMTQRSYGRTIYRLALLTIFFIPLIAGHGGAEWNRRIEQFAETDRRTPPALGGIVFAGSSSIELWDRLSEDFSGYNVLNRGLSGAQLFHVTYLADRIILPYRPRMIVLYAGENDLMVGRSPEQVLASFDVFVQHVRKDLPRVTIAFISIKPTLARRDLLATVKTTNEKIEQYTAEHENIRYIDVFSAMLNNNRDVRSDLFDDDGVHINRSGYQLWKTIIAPALRE